MDLTLLPQDLVTPLDYIAPGVKGLRIVFVNVFGVSHRDGSWTLIDTGLASSAPFIRRWAEEEFHFPPRAIVLTHGHADHAGAAGRLALEWNVPIQAHPLEFPYLAGHETYPEPPAVAGRHARGPIDLSGRLQPAIDLLGWEVLHTPGHTPGHLSFCRTGEGTLLSGDAVSTTRPDSLFSAPFESERELHGLPGSWTADRKQAIRSIERLAQLNVTTLAPGHGKPLTEVRLPALLKDLAARFDSDAAGEEREIAS